MTFTKTAEISARVFPEIGTVLLEATKGEEPHASSVLEGRGPGDRRGDDMVTALCVLLSQRQ